jgi:hypothetical protein
MPTPCIIEALLFDKLIDYLKYKEADFSEHEWFENGFTYVKEDIIIKTCRNIRQSKRFEIRTDDSVNPNNSVYPYSRFFFWHYTNTTESDRCYLYEHAVFDEIFFVFKRKSELSFSPISYFGTLEEAEREKERLNRN